MDVQAELTDGVVDEFAAAVAGNSFDFGKVVDVLLYSETVEEGVVLRAVSDEFPHLLKIALQVHPLDRYRSGGGFFLGCEDLEGRGFSSAVDSEECKALTLGKSERQALDCTQWHAWVAGAAPAHVNLPQILNTDLQELVR